MTFNSLTFIFLFLPAALAGYFVLGRLSNRMWSKLWLVLVSLVFVGAGRLQDIPLLLGSAAVNCFLAIQLIKGRGLLTISNRRLLTISIIANVAFLCAFKYAAFFVDTFNYLFKTTVHVPQSHFPLGISFYTIYQIMFLVDCYEGLVEEHNPLDHFVFATLFPYVTMGPIVRWKQVLPQLNDPANVRSNVDNFAKGLFVFAIGLFKKVVLADSFFRWADAGFNYGHPLSFVGGWLAALAYTFQLYFDFSGYTDMAVGIGLMLNLKLPQNFNAPFRATNIIDYWKRWHMTLTNFITTYLYTPMIRAMAKPTFGKAMLATFLAMLIAGLWHGANSTFIVFGGIHGAALVVNQIWKKRKWAMPAPLAWLAMFGTVVVSLVFFRSANVSQAVNILASMFSFRGGVVSYDPWTGIDRIDQLVGIAWMMLGVGIVCRAPASVDLERKFRPSWATLGVAVTLAVIACIYANGVVSRSFLYRDF